MRNGERGFSLVEVIVAIGLLTAVFVGVAHLFAASASANASARRITLATIAAVDKMEQLGASAFDDPVLGPSPPNALAADVDGYSDVPFAGGRRRWAIEPLAAFPSAALILRVIVLSRSGAVDARLVTIKTRKQT